MITESKSEVLRLRVGRFLVYLLILTKGAYSKTINNHTIRTILRGRAPRIGSYNWESLQSKAHYSPLNHLLSNWGLSFPPPTVHATLHTLLLFSIQVYLNLSIPLYSLSFCSLRHPRIRRRYVSLLPGPANCLTQISTHFLPV